MSELSIAPREAVPSSAKHNSESDNTLGYNVILLKNDRIFFMRKAELSFKINDAELSTSAAWNIKNNADFLDQEVGIGGLFATQEEDEPNIYGPPIKMGNHTIWQVTGASGPQANKIKLLCGDKFLVSHFAGGKPDILLVSQHDHERASIDKKGKCVYQGDPAGVEITRVDLLWPHVLLRSEFKGTRYKEGKDKGKRPFDSLAEECNMENSWPTKAFRSSTLRRGARPTGVSSLLRTGRLNGTGTTERKVNSITHTSCATPKVVPLRSDPESQLHGFVTGMSSANGDHIWLFLKDTKAYLRYYHQSRVMMFDGIDSIECFAPLAILFMLCVMGGDGQAGLSLKPVPGWVNPFYTKPDRMTVMHYEQVLCHEYGASFRLVENADIHHEGKFHTYYSLLVRGTDIHDVEMLGNTTNDLKFVVRSSCQMPTRGQARRYIAEARNIESIYVIQELGQAVITNDCLPDELRDKCSQKCQEYEKKEIRFLPEGKHNSISEMKDPENFWKGFLQCLRSAHMLYSKCGILHRDTSFHNLRIHIDENGEYVGILLDSDFVSTGPRQQSNLVHCGSVPFMARELLDNSKLRAQCFRHELESFFYVLVWHTLGRRDRTSPIEDLLHIWREGSWYKVMKAKDNFILDDWIDIFPDSDPDSDFLRVRCASLCYYFFTVGQDLIDRRLSQWSNPLGVKQKERLARGDTDYTMIVFGCWLKRVGELKDSDVCDKDCCV